MNGIALIKEAAGFLGSAAIAVPWLRDYAGRQWAFRVDPAKFTNSLGDLAKEQQANGEMWLAKPKGWDMGFTAVGLFLLVVSFGIGVVQAL